MKKETRNFATKAKEKLQGSLKVMGNNTKTKRNVKRKQ